jgi:hypothetical protein
MMMSMCMSAGRVVRSAGTGYSVALRMKRCSSARTSGPPAAGSATNRTWQVGLGLSAGEDGRSVGGDGVRSAWRLLSSSRANFNDVVVSVISMSSPATSSLMAMTTALGELRSPARRRAPGLPGFCTQGHNRLKGQSSSRPHMHIDIIISAARRRSLPAETGPCQ